MAGRLTGRVAVVTGGGGGIGAAVARGFAREGAAVIVNDLGVELDGTPMPNNAAEAVVAEIEQAGGLAMLHTGDISRFDDAQALVGSAADRYGHLDIVVNTAGILRDRMIFNMTEAEWDDVIRVHLRGSFNLAHHASAMWKAAPESGHRRLIFFTSGSGLHGGPAQPNYAAAKMGIVGLTYSCSNALQRYGITTNAIAPRAITRMTGSIPDGRRRRGSTPQQADEGHPDNVLPILLYLASTESDWCSGQVFAARGYEIGLYSLPTITDRVVTDGPWDLDQAFAEIDKVFKPVVTSDDAPAREATVTRG